jgi:hypothetical protein
MDEFIFLLIFMVMTTTAILYLIPWFERRGARIRLQTAERKLHYTMLFAPEWDATDEEHHRYENKVRWLRREMQLIIDRHGIHPLDSIKPF